MTVCFLKNEKDCSGTHVLFFFYYELYEYKYDVFDCTESFHCV